MAYGVMLWEMLHDLESIKLAPGARKFVKNAIEYYRESGGLSSDDVKKVRLLYKRHRRKINELHHARERGWRSYGKERLGLTEKEINNRVEERLQLKEKLRSDLGI